MEPCASDDAVVKEGWLQTRGLPLGRRERRFCGLTRSSLIIRPARDATHEQRIPLSASTRVHVLSQSEFSIVLPSGEPRRFKVSDPSSLSEWVLKIREATSQCTDLSMDSFEIISVIGRGFYGKVMLCQRINTTKLYAIKSIHKDRLVTSEQLRRVFLERDVLCQLNHPFIVKLAFCFDTAVKVYFGMEYVPGGELSDRLEERELSIGDARLYVAQVALALCHIHEKMVIYRDLKPQNILLDELGYVKLIDFGLAHVCERPDEKLRTFCGTPQYIAPEMVQKKFYGAAIDWWALGILTFELIVGTSPFHRSSDARTYQAILHDDPRYRTMDPTAVDFISRLLKKNPYERMVGREVLEHPFLRGVDFDALLERTIRMPFVPSILRGIGPHVERGESAADSRAEAATLDPAAFSGFSFTDETILNDAEYVALDVALRPSSKTPDT